MGKEKTEPCLEVYPRSFTSEFIYNIYKIDIREQYMFLADLYVYTILW